VSREHDIFYGPQRKPDGSIVMDFSYHTINGRTACVKCDEVWPCQALLTASLLDGK
jgi:hypothetical protein